MLPKYPHLIKAFEKTVVVEKGEYPYPISPFAGVTQPISPELLNEIAQAVRAEPIFIPSTLIVTFESAGIQLAAIASQILNIPYLIARKKRFDLPHEISFSVTTNFDKKKFYIYGEVKNQKILLIDDVVASGTTLKNTIVALKKAGAQTQAMLIVAGKNNSTGKKYQETLADISVPLKTLISINIVNNRAVAS